MVQTLVIPIGGNQSISLSQLSISLLSHRFLITFASLIPEGRNKTVSDGTAWSSDVQKAQAALAGLPPLLFLAARAAKTRAATTAVTTSLWPPSRWCRWGSSCSLRGGKGQQMGTRRLGWGKAWWEKKNESRSAVILCLVICALPCPNPVEMAICTGSKEISKNRV